MVPWIGKPGVKTTTLAAPFRLPYKMINKPARASLNAVKGITAAPGLDRLGEPGGEHREGRPVAQLDFVVAVPVALIRARVSVAEPWKRREVSRQGSTPGLAAAPGAYPDRKCKQARR